MKSTQELLKRFSSNEYDALLEDIYIDTALISRQRSRYMEAIRQFEKLYGESAVEIYSAAGRSEVGGNHTDHQQGMVLAASVNLDTIAVVSYNEDNVMRIESAGYKAVVVPVEQLEKRAEEVGTSAALIRGVAAGLKQRGYQLGGFNAYITSEVQGGAGLSSSASYETIIGAIISGLFNDMRIGMVEIAQVGQFAENVYFDKPCGLMDQMACAVGGLIHIDFKDPADPVVDQLDVDFEKYEHSLCIVDTKGSHQELTDEYAMIPAEMKAVAGYFGQECLRAVDETAFYQVIPQLREQLGDRSILRAIHFFAEEKRVAAQVAALREGAFEQFLQSIAASGHSSFEYLQNVYTNRDVQNQSVSLALSISEKALNGRGASRVHGGGFAGTIQAFVPNDEVQAYKQQMEAVFGPDSCAVLKVRKYGGMKVL